MNPIEVVKLFIEKINSHSVNELCELMSEDHVFVDGGGDITKGKVAMQAAWHNYFSMMPDYCISIEHIFASDNAVGVFGKAEGTFTIDGKLKKENHWQVPAAWYAIVNEERINHWQVYVDSDSIRNIFSRETNKK